MSYPSFCVWYSVKHHVSDALIHKNNQLIKSASLVGAGAHCSAAQPRRQAACLSAPSAAAEQEGAAPAHLAVHAHVQKPWTPGVLPVCAMLLPDTCHQGTAAPPMSPARKTKSNSGAPVMKLLEWGFRPLTISLFFWVGGAMAGSKSLPCISIAMWTPRGHPTLLAGGPTVWTLAGRNGMAGMGPRRRLRALRSLYFSRRGEGHQQVTSFTGLLTAWKFWARVFMDSSGVIFMGMAL